MARFINLFELRELCRPIKEREEAERKKEIARFLDALAPNNYPKRRNDEIWHKENPAQ